MKLRKSFKFIKEKSGRAMCRHSVLGAPILLNFFFKLHNYKVGKVKKFEHMVEEKCAIANGRSGGSLRSLPGLIGLTLFGGLAFKAIK